MKRLSLITIVILTLLISSIASYGQPLSEDLAIKAQAALLIDLDTGEILYQRNADLRLAPASITKLMTYLVAMDAVEAGTVNLNDSITISKEAASIGGSSLRLMEGEVLPLSDLLESMLIVSANDGAVSVAQHVGGDVQSFIDTMNEKAAELGMKDTVYLNVNGLPDGDGVPELGHFTTARDIITLSAYLINKYPQVIDITSKKTLELEYRNYKRNNTNTLLQTMAKLDGFKTGWTDEAGYCLVSTMDVTSSNSDGARMRLLAVILNSPTDGDRFRDSKTLLEYGEAKFLKSTPVNKDQSFGKVDVLKGRELSIDAVAKENITLVYNREKGTINSRVVLKENVRAPLNMDTVLGTVEIYQGNEKLQSVNLYPQTEVKKAGFFLTIKRFFLRLFGK